MVNLLLFLVLQATAAGYSPAELWELWPEERVIETPAPCLRSSELGEALRALAAEHPGKLNLEEIGRSYEGRPIHLLTLGQGERRVLLWSQMHGDEPAATPALLDIAAFLLAHDEEEIVRTMLDQLTLLIIPMLNPDGAEIYQRRNQQGIDINRDALNLATPEGRLLKEIRDRYEPMLAFNLHDQNRRTAVGNTGVLATNAVLAVAGDEANTLTPGRARAKRACSAIVAALAPFVPHGMARYDEDWSPRAFGDNITAWGTPVILIESGGLPRGQDFSHLARTNFVAILSVLQELVRNDLAHYDPQVYEDLPRNQSDVWADVILRGGFLRQPGVATPYRADLALDIEIDDREVAGCAGSYRRSSYLVEVGDARFLAAGREVDAAGSLLVAPFVATVNGWRARRWLNPGVLQAWARAGVGRVIWAMPASKLQAAKALARQLAGAGHSQLEVRPKGGPLPWLRLTGPPSARSTPVGGAGETETLARSVTRLAGAAQWRQLLATGSLEELWHDPAASTTRPALRRGVRASFLLLSPAPDGVIDLASVRLATVFADGQELGDVQ